ncbi:MAG: glycosyltransferase family 2 protein, partial [Alphaproteobacteria bacterium]
MDSPAISVLMPVFNGSEHLSAAIRSVLRQSFPDFELLILDDGSSEPIQDIVAGFEDDRITFWRRENRGLGATLNELAGRARAPILARIDADDICEPSRFADQYA